MRTEWRAGLTTVAMIGIAYAQAGPTFEVSAAIAAGNSKVGISRTPHRIAFQSAHVGDIVAFAYHLPLDRIEGRPQWMYDDLYNVAVTTSAPSDLPQQRVVLQKLLEERFGLVVHRTLNESPIYFLVSGTTVPNLTPTKESDPADLPVFRGTFQSGASGVPRNVTEASHVSMADLADWLYLRLQLPVLDKTGITGLFDIEIPGLPVHGGADGTIRAVQNALGLNLILHPGTAETLIIDRAEKPKEN